MRQTASCTRCGIERVVKPERESTGLCMDCLVVERDLAAGGCGTERGYYRHRYQHTLACEPCLAAHRDADRHRRRQRGIRPRLTAACGTDSGYQRHLKRRESACDECRAAHAADERRYYMQKRESAA